MTDTRKIFVLIVSEIDAIKTDEGFETNFVRFPDDAIICSSLEDVRKEIRESYRGSFAIAEPITLLNGTKLYKVFHIAAKSTRIGYTIFECEVF